MAKWTSIVTTDDGTAIWNGPVENAEQWLASKEGAAFQAQAHRNGYDLAISDKTFEHNP